MGTGHARWSSPPLRHSCVRRNPGAGERAGTCPLVLAGAGNGVQQCAHRSRPQHHRRRHLRPRRHDDPQHGDADPECRQRCTEANTTTKVLVNDAAGQTAVAARWAPREGLYPDYTSNPLTGTSEATDTELRAAPSHALMASQTGRTLAGAKGVHMGAVPSPLGRGPG